MVRVSTQETWRVPPGFLKLFSSVRNEVGTHFAKSNPSKENDKRQLGYIWRCQLSCNESLRIKHETCKLPCMQLVIIPFVGDWWSEILRWCFQEIILNN